MKKKKNRFKPILEPREHEVVVEKMGLFGEGIARLNESNILFIPFGAVGERCVVREVAKRKHYIQCKKLSTIETGPDQVTPKCSVFGICGGCQLQHLSYEAQVEQKRQVLEHVVRKQLDCSVSVTALACPMPYGYRRRTRFRQREGQVGYFKKGTLDFLSIPSCPVAVDSINSWLSDEKNFPRPDTVHDISLDAFDDGSVKTYTGAEQTQMGFRQANAWGEAILRELIGKACQKGQKGILELYSGSGQLVLPEFKPAPDRHYLGVDGDPVNIENGKKCFPDSNISFEVGTLPRWMIEKNSQDPGFFESFGTVILDPPRSGIGEELSKVEAFKKIPELIYISCDPISWSHDVRKLHSDFELKEVIMVDMFPQTRHFEVFSRFVSKV